MEMLRVWLSTKNIKVCESSFLTSLTVSVLQRQHYSHSRKVGIASFVSYLFNTRPLDTMKRQLKQSHWFYFKFIRNP